MNILFRVDYGSFIGLGHISRSSALAEELISQGHNVFFASRFEPGQNPDLRLWKIPGRSESFIKMNPAQYLRTSNRRSWLGTAEIEDAQETRQIAERHKIDLVVLDHYGLRDEWFAEWSKSIPTILITDFQAPSGSDVIVDYGFDASLDKHNQWVDSESQLLLGPKYTPLSFRYSKYRKPPHREVPARPIGLISLGGASSIEAWGYLLNQLKPLSTDVDFRVVGRIPSSIQHSAFSSHFSFHESNCGLVDFFEEADFSILTAGVSMYERLASGGRGLSLVVAENQQSAFQAAEQMGLVSGSSLEQFKTDTLLEILDALKTAEGQFPSWIQGRSAVDELGPKRIALKTGLSKHEKESLRTSESSDAPFLFGLANQSSSRANSFTGRRITPSEHQKWLESDTNTKQIWIYESGGVPVAQCRLENKEGVSYLSYSVDETFQGFGFANRMLERLLRERQTSNEIYAEVKPSNTVSFHILSKHGFKVFDSTSERMILVYPVNSKPMP